MDIYKKRKSKELIFANNKLAFQNEEKEKRAAELIIANKELRFQNEEKEKRAIELAIANEELLFQNGEKEKRASELVIANTELVFQNNEKEKRAAELIIANKELAFQNGEKEKRAAELIIANTELAFQNAEKEKRAAELIITNTKLAFQKKQLEDFCNIISHNLRAPLVNISMLVDFITTSKDENEQILFREKLTIATNILNEIFNELIESLQVKEDTEIKSEKIILKDCVLRVCDGLQGEINKSHAIIETNFDHVPFIYFPPKYMTSIVQNLVSNSLKYRSPDRNPIIKIETNVVNGNTVLSVSDNGLGIDIKANEEHLFKIRKVFHVHPDAKGFGLFITKSQVDAMGGRIWVESAPDEGAAFFVEFKTKNA